MYLYSEDDVFFLVFLGLTAGLCYTDIKRQCLFVLFLFPRDVLVEIWDLTGSVSEGFPTYFYYYYLRWPCDMFDLF